MPSRSAARPEAATSAEADGLAPVVPLLAATHGPVPGAGSAETLRLCPDAYRRQADAAPAGLPRAGRWLAAGLVLAALLWAVSYPAWEGARAEAAQRVDELLELVRRADAESAGEQR